MNDNLLIAAVLREVAAASLRANSFDLGMGGGLKVLAAALRERAEALDPPEKNDGEAS